MLDERLEKAAAVGLAEREVDVDALPIGEVTSLDRYGAVALGSAVYIGRWLGEARRAAQLHASASCAMPGWLFSSERAVARTIHAPEEDDRDWDAIDRFAGEIADELLRAHVAT